MANPTQVRFQPEQDEFYSTLKTRVNQYFTSSGNSRYADRSFYTKAVVLTILYLSFYSITLFGEPGIVSFACYIMMGPLAIIMGLNIAHDAAHRAISPHQKMNDVLLLTFDMLGANSYIWKKRHVFSHHSFPNIIEQDADLKQTDLVRIFPHDRLLRTQRFQHLYMPFLYMLYTLNWLVIRDIQDFRRQRIGSFRQQHIATREVVKLVFFKVFYLTYILLIPALFSGFDWWMVGLGYLLMNAAAGVTITLALVPAHVASTSHFPLPDENGQMAHSWSHHQLLTTTDYGTHNAFLNWLMGGFNHHIVHHLFPTICHVHYKHLTPIVKQTAEDFGLKYNHESSLANAYISHFRLLKRNGWDSYKATLELES